jgi:GNAT superfamily N-acetyltransferase
MIGCVDSDAPGPVPARPPAALPAPRFRAAGAGDATGLLALKKELDRETSFMLLEPGERAEDSAHVAADLSSMAGAANCAIIVAEAAGQLVGYAEARGGGFRRNRITAHVVIGVLAAASGQGVGSGLLRELELWALATEYTGWSSRSWPTTTGPASCMSAWASP